MNLQKRNVPLAHKAYDIPSPGSPMQDEPRVGDVVTLHAAIGVDVFAIIVSAERTRYRGRITSLDPLFEGDEIEGRRVGDDIDFDYDEVFSVR